MKLLKWLGDGYHSHVIIDRKHIYSFIRIIPPPYFRLGITIEISDKWELNICINILVIEVVVTISTGEI